MIRNDDPSAPADLLRVFMWNITNLAAVRAGAKPVLDEVGPFVYRKWRIKEVRNSDTVLLAQDDDVCSVFAVDKLGSTCSSDFSGTHVKSTPLLDTAKHLHVAM